MKIVKALIFCALLALGASCEKIKTEAQEKGDSLFKLLSSNTTKIVVGDADGRIYDRTNAVGQIVATEYEVTPYFVINNPSNVQAVVSHLFPVMNEQLNLISAGYLGSQYFMDGNDQLLATGRIFFSDNHVYITLDTYANIVRADDKYRLVLPSLFLMEEGKCYEMKRNEYVRLIYGFMNKYSKDKVTEGLDLLKGGGEKFEKLLLPMSSTKVDPVK